MYDNMEFVSWDGLQRLQKAEVVNQQEQRARKLASHEEPCCLFRRNRELGVCEDKGGSEEESCAMLVKFNLGSLWHVAF